MAKLDNIKFGNFNFLPGSSGIQGRIGSQGVTGGVTGPLLTNKQSGSYTLVANDLGKIVSGISTVIIPQNIFSVGSQVSIASTNIDINIKPGTGVTMLQSGVGIKTSVDIGQKSFASILCVSNNVFVVNGYLKPSISIVGGTKITSGNTTYHVFLSPGFLQVSGSISAEVLVVAGGASGGGYLYLSGGGGAGGVCHTTNYPLTSGSYTVAVGNGGASTPNTSPGVYAGNDGSPSVFGTIIAVGGGGGGTYPSTAGRPGGSGGGGAGASSPNAGGTSTQSPSGGATGYGNAGGTGFPSTPAYGGGGGGGAGGSGNNGGPTIGGAGGSGRAFPSFPAPVIAPAIPAPLQVSWISAVGPTGLFGGGGGGSTYNPSTPGGAGGSGGGGAGGNQSVTGIAGVDYTGGGGGASITHTAGLSGKGGNGIVIVRYQV